MNSYTAFDVFLFSNKLTYKEKIIFLKTLIRAHFQKDLILNNLLGNCEKKCIV